MKIIIDGKVYSTETAKEIGSWDNGFSSDDFQCETLYVKKTGEFFLHGCGGAMSKYDSTTGGEHIIPLNYDQARKLAESHLSADIIEKFFGICKDEDHVYVRITMPAKKASELRQAASKAGMSLSAYINTLL